MKTTESEENYLEIILVLSMIKPVVRSVDVADRLNVTKPSVSVAMKNLREKEMITVDNDGFIYLTDAGRKVAESIFARHQLIYKSLIKLGVDEKIAFHDACRIEHRISRESFDAIQEHVGDLLKDEKGAFED